MTWREIMDSWSEDRKIASRIVCDTCQQGLEIDANTRAVQRIIIKLGEAEEDTTLAKGRE